MESGSAATGSGEPDRLLQSLKRQTIPTACNNCRVRKVKCDGRLPCSHCTRRSVECSYESTLPSETPQQARKRRYQELTRRSEGFKELYDVLAGDDEARALNIFNRIRRGDDADSIFDYIQNGSDRENASATLEEVLQRLFLFNLVESTATLEEVASTSSAIMSNTGISLPPVDAYAPLKDRVVTLDQLSGILTDANPQRAIEAPPQRPIIHDTIGPLHWVPAQPWVEASDKDVSHLLSLFFAYPNLCWRFIEIQPFLQAMRGQDRKSRYCSPFLVNAMMGFATLHSDFEEDHASTKDLAEKGGKYHKEAMRLSAIAASDSSLTNVQGLSILAVDCIVRGKDQQGLGLLSAACRLNASLHLPPSSSCLSKDEQEYCRVRACAWWMTVHVDLTCKIGMMLGGNDTDWTEAPALGDLLPDTISYWIGYPYCSEPIGHRSNLLFLHQCSFTRLLWEATNILIWNASELDARREHFIVVEDLAAHLERWRVDLPRDLQFGPRSPPNLYDMHVQYHCAQMALHERTFMQMFGPMHRSIGNVEEMGDEENDQVKTYLRTKVLEHCYGGATLIRAYRETYGLKCVSLILLNHSIMGVFICLNDMHANPPRGDGTASEQTGPVRDTIAALEEFFRVLLATSRKWTLARGLARTAYHTAMEELKVKLPESILGMIRIMADTSWQSSDSQQLRATVYPNWSMPYVRDTNRVENFRMGEMLAQWEPSGARQPDAARPRPTSSSGIAYDPVRDR